MPHLPPGVKGLSPNFNADPLQASTSGEGGEKGQLIVRGQRQVRVHQLLIHSDADALEGTQTELIPDRARRGALRWTAQATFAPTGPFPQ